MSPMMIGSASYHVAPMAGASPSEPMPSYESFPGFHLQPSSPLGQSDAIAVTFQVLIDENVFEEFVKDKAASHFLQENYPEKDTPLRTKLFEHIDATENMFEDLAKHAYANFFIQKMIEKSTPAEQDWITSKIHNNMFSLCLDRYSCRVVQKAFEVLSDRQKALLLKDLHNADLAALAVDQGANHVIQKILKSFDLPQWAFIAVKLMAEVNFFRVIEHKYGCRIIQFVVERLATEQTPETESTRLLREALLEQMMETLLSNCERLSSNEFANYVVQHVITTPALAEFRDAIIERCLMGNLLSMSQEKCASHVVEKALTYAPSHLLIQMMDEIFDGYAPHPETSKDALDILIFHQFGNYVIQRVLKLCISYKSNLDQAHRIHWLMRMQERISKNVNKLQRFSSGKKIIDMLHGAGVSTGMPAYRI